VRTAHSDSGVHGDSGPPQRAPECARPFPLPTFPMDSAAPVGVTLAPGYCSRLDGSPLRHNPPRPYLPDLVSGRREVAGDLLDALAGVAA